MTVAQRIDGIGVHNVRIQVTMGMIDEYVSTLLFVSKKSVICYVCGFWFSIFIHVDFCPRFDLLFTFECVGLA